jgi:lipopolysaccharide export system protein LptC
MVMTLRNSLISLLFVIAISLSVWSILVSHDAKPTHLAAEENLPDAFMENVVATIMNKQGTPALKIVTPKMVHYANHDLTDIQKPAVTVYRNSPNPWYINSDFAEATQGISQIVFSSNVVIHHVADLANPTTTMQTTTLTVFPDKQQAKTNEAITITQPDTIVHAIGMLADMNNGTVKLLSQAKGEYVPASKG